MTAVAQFQAVNPLDLTPVADLTPATPEQVAKAVSTARDAQDNWAKLTFRQRGIALGKVRDKFAAARAEILDALKREHGKSEFETIFNEIVPAYDIFDYWIGNTEKLLAQELLPLDPVKWPSKRGKIVYEPKGVIGIISPWNYPINLPLRTIVPALMAGDTVVFKPSEHGVLAGRILNRLFSESLPFGVFQVLEGDGVVGAALVSGGVDHVSFTGSVATGRKVALLCAERLISCSLELGGKAAAIVMDDADMDRAVNGILWAKFHNAGQNCSAVERIYVHQRVAEQFTSRFLEAASRLRVGLEGEYPVLPLRTEAQRRNVEMQVADARARGGQVLVGGERSVGLGFQPTVCVKLPQDAELLTRETFGPAVGIVPVKDVEEAVRKANDSELGLTASIWTRDLAAGERIAMQLQVGVAIVNNACFTGPMPFAPWGGRKNSGHGYTGSHLALRELVHAKTILIDGERSAHELWWYPYSPIKRAIGEKLIALMSGKAGLGDILGLVGLMPRRFK